MVTRPMSSSSSSSSSSSFPLSAQQQFHWETLRFRSLGRAIAGRDGPFISVRLNGGLDVARLRAALAELASRHESLRTTLTDVGPDPSQRVAPHIELPFSFVDLSSVAASHRNELARRVVAAERSTELDLVAGPLWHCLVVELSPVAHVLALHFCHLVIDGVSLMSFFEQLAGLYEGKAVPRPTCQYRDYVQQSGPDAEELERRLAYWRRELLPRSPRLAFPTDYAASPPALVST
ncbi:MAG: hypothetical protein H7138_09310, partial [Myxococcales bacterium]|nr:hypothetical protein [Myxococcales bacterium]